MTNSTVPDFLISNIRIDQQVHLLLTLTRWSAFIRDFLIVLLKIFPSTSAGHLQSSWGIGGGRSLHAVWNWRLLQQGSRCICVIVDGSNLLCRITAAGRYYNFSSVLTFFAYSVDWTRQKDPAKPDIIATPVVPIRAFRTNHRNTAARVQKDITVQRDRITRGPAFQVNY